MTNQTDAAQSRCSSGLPNSSGARRRGFHLNLALLVGSTALAAGAGGAAPAEAQSQEWQKRLTELSNGDALRMNAMSLQVAQADATAAYDIAAQPLGQALIRYSEISGISVIADSTLIDGVTSAALSGSYSPDEALAALLAGTGIGYRPTAQGTVTLERVAAGDSQQLQPLTVTDSMEQPLSEGYKPVRQGSPKNTQPLLDTPKTVVVVTEKQMEDRGISSLKEALRTVPGVTMNQGEGGQRGTNFRIRGFDGNRSDNFVDGIRDATIGSFKDTFNYEQIEVNKGPSSSVDGRGSASGSINSVTKTPKAESFYDMDGSLGTDGTKRVTVDLNQAIPEEYTSVDGMAFRLNGLWTEAEVAERDVTESERWGIAPSFAFGLGEPFSGEITYMHAESDDIPDYGLPTYHNKIPSEVDRDNFYHQSEVAQENSNIDVVGLNLEWAANDWLTLANRSRAQWSDVFSIAGHVRTETTYPTVNVNHGARTYYDEFYNNQTTAAVDFATGPLDHEALVGFDISREERDVQSYSIRMLGKDGVVYTTVPNISLSDPDNDFIVDYDISKSTRTKYTGDTKAIYGYDTVSFLEDLFEVNGGLRYEWIDSVTTNATGDKFRNKDEYLSWQTGLVFKPVSYGSVYFGYGQSFTPNDADLSVSTTIPEDQAEPLETKTYELGTKWDLMDEKLSVTAAIFQTEKDGQLLNQGTSADPDYIVTGKQRVRGIELGLNGEISEGWNVAAGYTYMKGKIVEAASASDDAVFRNMPEHALSLWTTYDLPWFDDITVGAGATYMGPRKYRFGATTEENIPSYWVFDLMGQYRLTENVEFQFNLYNLTNEFYIDQVGGGFVTPGPGRSALLTTSLRF